MTLEVAAHWLSLFALCWNANALWINNDRLLIYGRPPAHACISGHVMAVTPFYPS